MEEDSRGPYPEPSHRGSLRADLGPLTYLIQPYFIQLKKVFLIELLPTFKIWRISRPKRFPWEQF